MSIEGLNTTGLCLLVAALASAPLVIGAVTWLMLYPGRCATAPHRRDFAIPLDVRLPRPDEHQPDFLRTDAAP